jgi:hypothetical protein
MTTRRESHHVDRKSLRLVRARSPTSASSRRHAYVSPTRQTARCIGIEDDGEAPPPEQRVEPALLDRIRERADELTVNVQVVPELKRHENGGECFQKAANDQTRGTEMAGPTVAKAISRGRVKELPSGPPPKPTKRRRASK